MNELNVVSIRLVKDAPVLSEKPICNPKDAVELLGEHMCQLDREVLCIINLKSSGVPINCNFISMGAVDQSLAHPREIFKSCILSNAASVLLLHNHPSGMLKPSRMDNMLTDKMLKLCDLIDIPLTDHIIVGGDNLSYFSFREKELLNFEPNKYQTDYHNLEFPDLMVAEEKAPEKSKLSENLAVDKAEITTMLEGAINDIFLKCQTETGIESGDIEPFMALKLEEKQKELSEIICKVLSYQEEQQELQNALNENAMNARRKSKCR